MQHFVGRKFEVVIGQLLVVIPNYEKQLRERLNEINQDAMFRAPENQLLSWEALREVLTNTIGPPVLDWEVQVGKIVRNEEI